ncbi:DNA repair ATPase, partial [Saccharothrix sp. MB29]|nr:DNA repair ATPase [Saccharothrix sp. MB29]
GGGAPPGGGGGRRAAPAAGLARRAEALNAQRLEVFGSTELALLGTERIRTEHNCVPRDCVSLSTAEGPGSQVAGLMLFG